MSGHDGYKRRRSRWLGVLAAAMLLGAPPPVRAEPLEPKVAVASSSMAYPAFWLGLADNMFEANGPRVHVTPNALSTDAAMLVSGRADVFVTNSLAGLRIAGEGKPISYICNVINIDAIAWALVSRLGVASMRQLASAGGK